MPGTNRCASFLGARGRDGKLGWQVSGTVGPSGHQSALNFHLRPQGT